MNFDNIDDIRRAGFHGLEAISVLQTYSLVKVPERPGVYLVVRPGRTRPDFLSESTGGHFKGKNPTVEVQLLKSRWIEDALVLYMGKTGGPRSKNTLKTRVKLLCDFGQGKPVGHWGGRLVWQLRDARDLQVCWKVIPEGDPRTVEKGLLREFETAYGKLPFANLIH